MKFTHYKINYVCETIFGVVRTSELLLKTSIFSKLLVLWTNEEF